MSEETSVTIFQKDTEDVLKITLSDLLEGITGIAVSEKRDYILSVGRILQAIRKGKFLSQLINEWNHFREKGRIKEDYQRTEQHYTCLQEMLDFLDKDSPDEIRFNTLKKILMNAAMETISNRDNILPQQYMKLCRTLSSGEILVLSTAYKISKRKPATSNAANDWLNSIAKESGLVHAALVEIHEDGLMKKYLITPREYPDLSGIEMGASYRLTSLGYDLCRFIEEYDKIESSQDTSKS